MSSDANVKKPVSQVSQIGNQSITTWDLLLSLAALRGQLLYYLYVHTSCIPNTVIVSHTVGTVRNIALGSRLQYR